MCMYSWCACRPLAPLTFQTAPEIACPAWSRPLWLSSAGSWRSVCRACTSARHWTDVDWRSGAGTSSRTPEKEARASQLQTTAFKGGEGYKLYAEGLLLLKHGECSALEVSKCFYGCTIAHRKCSNDSMCSSWGYIWQCFWSGESYMLVSENN